MAVAGTAFTLGDVRVATPLTPPLIPLTLISPVPGTFTEWGAHAAAVHAAFSIRGAHAAILPKVALVPLALISPVPGTIAE